MLIMNNYAARSVIQGLTGPKIRLPSQKLTKAAIIRLGNEFNTCLPKNISEFLRFIFPPFYRKLCQFYLTFLNFLGSPTF